MHQREIGLHHPHRALIRPGTQPRQGNWVDQGDESAASQKMFYRCPLLRK